MLGPSGSGKTTVLRLVAGFELPTAGAIELGGADVTRKAPFERDVNTVFQDYALFPHLDVLGNVEYGLRVRKVPRAERRARAAQALATGRLEQVGSPREVYGRPATAFVAGFVGTSNLLSSEASSALLGVPALHTVRPERITVVDRTTAPPDGRVCADGRVREVVYAGAST